MTEKTKFFAVDTTTNEVISGPHNTHDEAAAACQDAFREHADCDDEDRYQVDESCSIDIVEIDPSVGDVKNDAEYEAQLERLESCYTELETETRYCVCVRRARGRQEASGTYFRRSNGNLQILGHSIEVPADLRDLQERAWAKFCS